MKTLTNSILNTSTKLTNLSLITLSAYASLYYTNKENLIYNNESLNTFLDTMKDKFNNNPEEVMAAALTIAGSYMMGNKNPHIRFLTFVAWSVSNSLYSYIAIKNNMTPMLGQMAVFQLINFNAMKNILKDELIPQYKDELKQVNNNDEELDINLMNKLKSFKNKAVINSANRIEKVYDNIKDGIINTIDTIKKHKNNSMLLLTSLVGTTLYTLDQSFQISDKLPLILESMQKAITNSPIETTAAITALIGSYMLSKTGVDTKIKGISLFLAADFMYMNIASNHNMAPMLVQTLILVGGSLKALDNLYEAKQNLSNSEFKKEKKTIFNKIEDLLINFKNNNFEKMKTNDIIENKNIIERDLK